MTMSPPLVYFHSAHSERRGQISSAAATHVSFSLIAVASDLFTSSSSDWHELPMTGLCRTGFGMFDQNTDMPASTVVQAFVLFSAKWAHTLPGIKAACS